MRLQVITDEQGKKTGIFIPINDWEVLTQRHKELKELVSIEPSPKKKLSQLAGSLSHKTAEALLKNVEESRNEWEERLKKQF